jgi:hypothetical protein
MARVLYLVHRMPYPPNKGDKVPSHHAVVVFSSSIAQYAEVFNVPVPVDFVAPCRTAAMGAQARRRVVERYGWGAQLMPIDLCLEAA